MKKVTNIDFFPLLEDNQEELIEKTLCIECWAWGSVKLPSVKNENKATESVQCNGITKAGERCKNKTLSLNGYCYHHEGQIDNDTPKNKTEKNKQ